MVFVYNKDTHDHNAHHPSLAFANEHLTQYTTKDKGDAVCFAYICS